MDEVRAEGIMLCLNAEEALDRLSAFMAQHNITCGSALVNKYTSVCRIRQGFEDPDDLRFAEDGAGKPAPPAPEDDGDADDFSWIHEGAVEDLIGVLSGHGDDELEAHGIYERDRNWDLEDEVWWWFEYCDEADDLREWLDRVEGLVPGSTAGVRGLFATRCPEWWNSGEQR